MSVLVATYIYSGIHGANGRDSNIERSHMRGATIKTLGRKQAATTNFRIGPKVKDSQK